MNRAVQISRDDAPRRDVAAMLVPIAEALTAAELPIVHGHNLTMWAYVVLVELANGPVRGQLQLANTIGADKTRIISVLDGLQDRGLIHRHPDPDDRRVHLLAVTEEGSRLWASVQTAIQQQEERVLSCLDDGDREAFLRALDVLSSLPLAELTELRKF